MVQVLIIGRDAEGWKRSLETWSGLEVRAVSLPSAGIRTFEEASPDVVIVAEPPGSTKSEPMIQAIRDRPLGRLVPLIWVAPPEETGGDIEASSTVSPDVSPAQLVDEVETHLEVQLGRDPGQHSTNLAGESTAASMRSTNSAPVSGSARVESGGSSVREPDASPEREPVEGRDYVVEPIDDEPETDESGSTLFPQSSDPHRSGNEPSVDATDIERKIEEVRHQDYFSILEVDRTAGTEEVERAYHRLKQTYDPETIDGRVAQSYSEVLRDIGDALTDAYAVLADDVLREQYLQTTTRKG